MSSDYTYGVGGSCHRIVVCSGDHALLAAATDAPIRSAEDLQRIARQAAAEFASGMPCVTREFLFGCALSEVRETVAQAFRDGASDALTELAPLIATVDALRAALIGSSGRPLLETAELQLLHYPQGGSFRRHVDDRPGIKIGAHGRTDVRRSISFLIYLTRDDWDPAADGGALRFHTAQHGLIDVNPWPGTLAIFDSAGCSVLHTAS